MRIHQQLQWKRMRHALISLLYLCCSSLVSADPVDGTDCDARVQKQHQLLLQHDRAHLSTVRSAIRNLNGSLQALTQREQDVKEDAEKYRELTALLQESVAKMKNKRGQNIEKSRLLIEKLENEIKDLKLRILKQDFKLSELKVEEKSNMLQLGQLQSQEKELEFSISQQEQQDHIGPLENIETYLVAQLERSHETLEFERECCQFKLESTSKYFEAKLELADANLKLVELTSIQIPTEGVITIKNISEQLNNCEVENTNLTSENTRISAELSEKSRQLDAATRISTTTIRPTTWTPPNGAFNFSTGTYFLNTNALDWTLARKQCQALGMDLVAIETGWENGELAHHVVKLYGPWFIWTSGCYSRREDAVVWRSTGRNLTYTNWNAGHGNMKNEENCVYLYAGKNQRWHDITSLWSEGVISSAMRSICERI